MWGSNSSLLREKLWVLSSFLIVGGHARAEVYGKIVSSASPTHFDVGFFSHLPDV